MIKIKTSGDDIREFEIKDSVSDSPTQVPTSAAIVDYVAENAGGDTKTYYHARIVGGSTTPTVLSNTTGATCTITNPANGQYTFTFNSAVLTSDKTSLQLTSQESGRFSVSDLYIVNGAITSTTVVDVFAGRMDASPGFYDNTTADFEILITIYP